MAFRDDLQRARVCRSLFGKLGLRRLWKDNGPTPEARAFLSNPAGLSAERRTLLLLAWELWREKTTLTFHDLRSLPPRRLSLVGSLLVAMSTGPAAVDAWILRNEEGG